VDPEKQEKSLTNMKTKGMIFYYCLPQVNKLLIQVMFVVFVSVCEY